jgi:hypothetical protein
MRVTLAVIAAIFVILKGVHGRRYSHFVMGGIDSGLCGREDGATTKRKLLSLDDPELVVCLHAVPEAPREPRLG